MAVYTQVSAAELQAHLARYDVGAPLSHAGAAAGVENTNYIIATTTGRFVLTLFEGRTAAAAGDLPFCFGFMSHLRQKGLPVPAVLPDRQGGTVLTLKDRPAIVTSFLEGAPAAAPDAGEAAAAGSMLARLHLAAADYAPLRANPVGMKAWRALVMLCAPQADTRGLGDELEFLKARLNASLPRGAVHADFFPDNVFFRDGAVSGVIDFYFSCTDFFAYDLMLALNAWCFDAGVPARARMEAFLCAYSALRPLAPEEAESLPLLGRAAALRIVLTRLHDSLHPRPGAVVTPKDPAEHMRILQFHRGVESCADYGLAA